MLHLILLMLFFLCLLPEKWIVALSRQGAGPWVVSFLLPVLSRAQILAWPASVSGLCLLPSCGDTDREGGILEGWEVICGASLFSYSAPREITAKAKAKAKASSYQLLPHLAHQGHCRHWILKGKREDRRRGWMGGWVGRRGRWCVRAFTWGPRHEVLICSRGHYCDRLFTISDRLGLLRDLCYSCSWNV